MSDSFSSIWRCRNDALAYVDSEASERGDLIASCFLLADDCITTLERAAVSSKAAEIYGLTTLKAKYLAVGALSLILDGLGQEAGALMRPMIEYTELLTYVRETPNAVEAIHKGRNLPSAGERAKKIGGIYRNFRDHLNQHASHSAYSSYSLSHLRSPSTQKLKLFQAHVPCVLDRNLSDLAVQIYLMLREVLLCVATIDQSAFDSLGARYDDLRPRLFVVFGLEDQSDS